MPRKIVVIEDDPDLQLVFRIIIENAGFTVAAYSDGEHLRQDPDELPLLFLLDNQLPGRSGIEICRALKLSQKTKDIPVVIISAHKNLGERATSAGAAAFIEKPFDYGELIKLIKSLTLTPVG
jgi:DNA-binding response OmpR family regulator